MSSADPRQPQPASPSVERFLAAWRRGQHPSIEEYLSAGELGRLSTLAQLVRIDMEQRLRVGELVCVEAYLGRYPELSSDRGIVLDLILAEYQQRETREPDLNVDTYIRRFPQYRDELLLRFPTRGTATPRQTSRPMAPTVFPVSPPAPTSAPRPIVGMPLAETEPEPLAAAAPAPTPALVRETAVPTAVTDEHGVGGHDRVADAGMMAIFTGIFGAIVCALCIIALALHIHAGTSLALPLLTTVVVGVIAGLHLWAGRQTRRHERWAVWFGFVAAVLLLVNSLTYEIRHGFHIDGFSGMICFPLMILFVIQLGAYGVALAALYWRAPLGTSPSAEE